MSAQIIDLRCTDVRFPTSTDLAGSDAMNPDPDYSAAYLELITDDPALRGHGLTFTIGRGTEVQVAALEALRPHLIGLDVDAVVADLGSAYRRLVHDSQLRWLGPEKGVMHMAIGTAVNALWDLAARRTGQPVWMLLASMSPEQLVDLVDFRYLTDALTPLAALEILKAAVPGREQRRRHLLTTGYPAYTTGPGWLGYADEKLDRLARQAVADGFRQIKLKIGADLADDRRRLEIARRAVGPEVSIAVDANQLWDRDEAIAWISELAPHDLAWVEEPTSPDDVLAHAAIRRAIHPVRIATGEHAHNRIMFKQLLQAEAVDVVQIDAVRVGGVNENLATLLLAAKFGVPVCPHAGGVGLCELVQHLSMFDYVAVSGSMEGRMIEYVDSLHEHFVEPADVSGGRYRAPTAPGFSAELRASSIDDFTYPDGNAWRATTSHASGTAR